MIGSRYVCLAAMESPDCDLQVATLNFFSSYPFNIFFISIPILYTFKFFSFCINLHNMVNTQFCVDYLGCMIDAEKTKNGHFIKCQIPWYCSSKSIYMLYSAGIEWIVLWHGKYYYSFDFSALSFIVLPTKIKEEDSVVKEQQDDQ